MIQKTQNGRIVQFPVFPFPEPEEDQGKMGTYAVGGDLKFKGFLFPVFVGSRPYVRVQVTCKLGTDVEPPIREGSAIFFVMIDAVQIIIKLYLFNHFFVLRS